jgi:hypothetical protein
MQGKRFFRGKQTKTNEITPSSPPPFTCAVDFKMLTKKLFKTKGYSFVQGAKSLKFSIFIASVIDTKLFVSEPGPTFQKPY